MKQKDLTGMRFGRLTVVKKVEAYHRKDGKTESRYLCRCDCGTEKILQGRYLTGGDTKSCGCLRSETQRKRRKTHGMTNTRIFHIWDGMINRCRNDRKNTKHWHGKEIEVCTEWLGEHGFNNFYNWSIKNGYAENLTIDRIDVDGNYEPSNCRWVDYGIQNNNSANNVKIEYKGESKTIAEWAKEYGINYQTLYSRLKNGWGIDKALNKSLKK